MPPYRREEDLTDDSERYQYLREIHTAMAEYLFDWHGLRVATSDAMSSVGYLCVHDMDLCFETYFDECGDTCHRVFDMSEAKRLFDEQLSDIQTREAEIQERRTQIRLVKSDKRNT